MALLRLDKNENQYGPAPGCADVLRRGDLSDLSLYSRTYLKGTSSELSERLGAMHGIPEPRILLSYGSEDMLKQVVHCYLRAGETILLPQHSWWYYKSVASEVFGRQILYPVDEHGKSFEYDPGEIIRLYDAHHPHVILVASPNNPTGNAMGRKALDLVLEHCTASVIVVDEAYWGFSGEQQDSIRPMLDAHGRIVVLRTFSKYYALAGLRIGYACIGEDLSQLALYSARYLGYHRLSEKIAQAALDDPGYYRRIAGLMREDKDQYIKMLDVIPGYVPFRSEANFLLVRYPAPARKTLEAGLLRRGIHIKFLEDPGLTDCLRITIGTSEQNALVRSAFSEIAEEIAARPERTPSSST